MCNKCGNVADQTDTSYRIHSEKPNLTSYEQKFSGEENTCEWYGTIINRVIQLECNNIVMGWTITKFKHLYDDTRVFEKKAVDRHFFQDC